MAGDYGRRCSVLLAARLCAKRKVGNLVSQRVMVSLEDM